MVMVCIMIIVIFRLMVVFIFFEMVMKVYMLRKNVSVMFLINMVFMNRLM